VYDVGRGKAARGMKLPSLKIKRGERGEEANGDQRKK
jgi:hypothetical protein